MDVEIINGEVSKDFLQILVSAPSRLSESNLVSRVGDKTSAVALGLNWVGEWDFSAPAT